MANNYFQFKEFRILQDRTAMKVTTDACLLGAWAVQSLLENKIDPANVLDIGTGTGLLSLMLAQQLTSSITAVELEPNAAGQATENVAASPWAHRIEVQLQDAVTMDCRGRFDIVISNPPFYANDLKSPREAKATAFHEGMLSLNQLIPVIQKQLTDDGQFFLLLPYRRLQEARDLVHQSGLTIKQLVTVHPAAGHAPFRILLHGTKGPAVSPGAEEEKFIKDAEGNYTDWFTALLKPYYLQF